MKKGKLIDSFGYAIAGIFFCFRHERNMKIHYLAAVIVISRGFYFHITRTEWMILLIVIGCNEFRNGKYGCGKTVDLATADIHPFAKIAKDVAAGAVLLFAIIAVIIGAIIFYRIWYSCIPKLLLSFGSAVRGFNERVYLFIAVNRKDAGI